MRGDPRTKAYIERRTDKQLTTIEAMRCLERYVARELFADLPQQVLS
jgi:transposase